MKTIIKIILIAAILVALCSSVIYLINPVFFESLLPVEIRKPLELKRVSRSFPEMVGTYKMIDKSSSTIEIGQTCNKIEDNPILKVTGRTGNACMKTFSAEYSKVVASSTSSATSSVVRVSLSKFTSGAEALRYLVEKSIPEEVLGGKRVFRLTPFTLGWLPTSEFDFIVIQHGTETINIKSDGDKVSKIEYSGTASGDDEVTSYFLSKYGP